MGSLILFIVVALMVFVALVIFDFWIFEKIRFWDSSFLQGVVCVTLSVLGLLYLIGAGCAFNYLI